MLKAFGENIIAKRIGTENKNASGVIRTSSNKEKPLEIEVVATNVDDVVKGKRYLIARYSGTEIEYEGEQFIIITTDDIIARIEND